MNRTTAFAVSTLCFFLFFPLSDGQPEEYELALCHKIAVLMEMPGASPPLLVDPGNQSYLAKKREIALDAAEVLLWTLALPLSSRQKVQACMEGHDNSIDFRDPLNVFAIVEELIEEAKFIKVQLENYEH